jgi:hypothetical protein
LNVCLPHKDKFLRSQIVQRENYSVGQDDCLVYEVELSLAKLIEVEIGIINDQVFLVEKLKQNSHFNPQKNFVRLHSPDKDYLDEQTY